MKSTRTRLARFMSQQFGIKCQTIRSILALRRILVDASVTNDRNKGIHQFPHVSLDGQVRQNNKPR